MPNNQCLYCKHWKDKHTSGLALCVVNNTLTGYTDTCDSFKSFVLVIPANSVKTLYEIMKDNGYAE